MVSVYTVTHKKFNPPQIEGYIPIKVGEDLRERDLGYIRDNQGDNISEKNLNYCELTALYWIWKHDKSDIVGICHYRRYFSKYLLDNSSEYYVTVDEIQKILKSKDIILPKRYFWIKHDVATGYYEAGQGRKKDLKILREVIIEKCPDYISDYNIVLKSRMASYCNMLICKKNLYDVYCSWLFDILFEVEKRVDLSGYTPAEARLFGYMSELLVNVWVRHNKLGVRYLSVAVDKPLTKKRKPFAYIEKIPVLGLVSRLLLCMDLGAMGIHLRKRIL